MNLNPYLAFSKSLWHYPSLEDTITPYNQMVKIHETLFKLPLYGRLDSVNNITDVWFEAFAKNIQSLINSSSSRFFYVDSCSIKNLESAVCLYIFDSKSVEKRVYGTSGLLQKEIRNINNRLFDKNLVGVSMSPYNYENTSESGLYYNGQMYPLNRGINAFFLRGIKVLMQSKTMIHVSAMALISARLRMQPMIRYYWFQMIPSFVTKLTLSMT
ncbi:hypothetical protein [Escherichia coli]|uniref:hypothetical protein n=1 Tax=Escherichia coli TaxID=562 RepID=UPI003D7B3A96